MLGKIILRILKFILTRSENIRIIIVVVVLIVNITKIIIIIFLLLKM